MASTMGAGTTTGSVVAAKVAGRKKSAAIVDENSGILDVQRCHEEEDCCTKGSCCTEGTQEQRNGSFYLFGVHSFASISCAK